MVDRDDIERLKEVFVTRQECDMKTDVIERRLAEDGTQLELIKQQLSTIAWVAKTTLGAVIGFIVVYVANLILR